MLCYAMLCPYGARDLLSGNLSIGDSFQTIKLVTLQRCASMIYLTEVKYYVSRILQELFLVDYHHLYAPIWCPLSAR